VVPSGAVLCCADTVMLCCFCRVDHSMTLIEKLIQQIERAVQVSMWFRAGALVLAVCSK
jgi:hypothetical protein